ncbi:MAG: SGNH/GDSL hydrolase family protein [Lachnospiraceae bacterium]|nr:SGNH/GDSL hydrolase family protein [Lachnospiraceae bacterium]
MTNEELKKYYFGAYSFEETEDGYLQAFQYTKAQMDYFQGAFDFWYDRCMASTSKTIELNTEATKVSFDFKIIWMGSPDSFELQVDGQITQIKYVMDYMKADLPPMFGKPGEGGPAGKAFGEEKPEPPQGGFPGWKLPKEGRIEWELPEGKKSVVIYLPADATVVVRNFEVNAPAERPAKNEKVLWLGDSITQGFGPLRSGQTYVTVANRILNYDIVNQGIGGYVYDKKSLMKMDGYQPDKIIVALGTNQYGSETMTDVEEYYETLTGIYGNEIPILCISPIWRGDQPEGYEKFVSFCENVKKIAGSYKNVTVVDGFTLVPHLKEYYLDNLHPNCLGTENYGRNLVEAIREIGF